MFGKNLQISTLLIVATLSSTVGANSDRAKISRISLESLRSFSYAQALEVAANDPTLYLQEIQTLLLSCNRYLNAYDLPKMKILEMYVARVLSDIADPKRGLVNQATMESFLDLIRQLDSSEFYFDRLKQNAFMADPLTRVWEIKGILATAHGFEKTKYAMNLHRLLATMQGLVKELIGLEIPESLRTDLNKMMPEFGFADAKAQAVGDRPEAFNEAKPVALKIQAMNESFNALANSRTAYQTALMIMFLNESLLDYGQYK